MKRIIELTGKAFLASLILGGSLALAASGSDETYKNLTLEERLYLFDGYGSKWGLDAGSDGLWFVADRPVPDTYDAALKIRNVAAANTLVVGGIDDQNATAGNVGIGTNEPQAKLDVAGDIQTKFNDTSSKDVTELVALDVNNTNTAKMSDTGFKLTNSKEGVSWTFRTLEGDNKLPAGSSNGFAISKKGSGAKEIIITAKDDPNGMRLILANGAYCDGVWHEASSRTLKNNIKTLDTESALETFKKLEPVTFVYKANPNDPHVGFIAEDVPELVADPSRKSISTVDIVAVLTKVVQKQEETIEQMQKEIADLKNMK